MIRTPTKKIRGDASAQLLFVVEEHLVQIVPVVVLTHNGPGRSANCKKKCVTTPQKVCIRTPLGVFKRMLPYFQYCVSVQYLQLACLGFIYQLPEVMVGVDFQFDVNNTPECVKNHPIY